MANTLLDAIKSSQNQTLQQTAAEPQQGAPSETQSLAQTVATGRTGKDVSATTGAPAAKMSNLQEKLAQVQNKLGTQALAKDVETQQTGMEKDAEVAAKEAQIQDTALEQRRQDTQRQYTRQVQSTIDNFTNQGKQLDLSKDKAKAEQLGFQLRMSNNKYIQDLKQEGAKARLSSSLKRREEIAKSVFADERDLFASDLSFRTIMGAKGRDLTEKLSNMDLDFAMKMADANNKAANERSLWTGIGGLAGAGVQAYGAYAAQPAAPSYSSTGAQSLPQAQAGQQAVTEFDQSLNPGGV